MRKPSNVVLFRLVYFLIYFADALFTPFYGLYLLSLSFSAQEVSVVLGVIPFAACLGSLLLGRISSSFKGNLRLMKILILFEILGVLLLAYLSSFGVLVGVVILLAFSNGVYYQIEDGASSMALKKEGRSFSSVRIFGSLGFLSALGACYGLLQVWRYPYLFTLAAGIFLLAFILLHFFMLPEEEKAPVPVSQAPKGHWGDLLLNRSFVFFLLFYFLLDGVVSIEGYCLPLYLNSLGMSDQVYSLLNAFRVAVEVVVVALYKPIKRLLRSDRNCLLLGAGILLFSSVGIILFQDSYAIAFTNYACRGVGGALLFIGFVSYLSAILPSASLTRGLSLCSALMDIMTGTFNFASAPIYLATSFWVFFAILSGVAALGFVFLFFAKDERKLLSGGSKEKE
jgi:PPP family 3-phenylpropionic acid transporter